MSKIAIVDLLFNWPPDGGARTDVKEIATRLSKDHEVCIFVPDFPRGFPRGQIRSRLDLNIRKIPFNRFTFNFLQVPYRFKKAIDRYKPDFVFIADGWHLKPYLVTALKKYKPILRFYAYEPLCIKQHGVLLKGNDTCRRDYLDGSMKDVLGCILCAVKWLWRSRSEVFLQEFISSLSFLPWYRNVVKRAIRSAGKIIVYNNFIRERILEFNRNVLVIPSGIDSNLFKPGEKIRGNGKIKILMVGRIEDSLKGFPTLYEACQLLREKRHNFQLLLTTNRKFKEDYIVPAGWLNQEDLADLYRQVDICVVPSIWPEPFGIVTLEAIASGKPLIITKVGGLQTLVKDNETGFVVEPGDVNALAQRLDKLLDDSLLRKELSEKAEEKILAHHQWDWIYERYYQNLFSSS